MRRESHQTALRKIAPPPTEESSLWRNCLPLVTVNLYPSLPFFPSFALPFFPNRFPSSNLHFTLFGFPTSCVLLRVTQAIFIFRVEAPSFARFFLDFSFSCFASYVSLLDPSRSRSSPSRTTPLQTGIDCGTPSHCGEAEGTSERKRERKRGESGKETTATATTSTGPAVERETPFTLLFTVAFQIPWNPAHS